MVNTMFNDSLTKTGAMILASRLENYWLERGKVIRTEIISNGFNSSARDTTWSVRSDMVNGFPKER